MTERRMTDTSKDRNQKQETRNCAGIIDLSSSLTFLFTFCWFPTFYSSCIFQVLVQDPFDLAIDTSEFIRSPFLQGFVGIVIDADDKGFFLAQGYQD